MSRLLSIGAKSCSQLLRAAATKNAYQAPRLLSLNTMHSARHNLPVLRDPFSTGFTPVTDVFRAMERTMRDFENNFLRSSWPVRRIFEEGSKEVLEDFPEVKYTSKDFTVKVNVGRFVEGDLKCELIDNNTLCIKGSHEVKSGQHGYSKQEMVREFALPEDVDRDSLQSALSEDGVLTISARVKGNSTEQRKTLKIEKTSKSSQKAESVTSNGSATENAAKSQ